MKKLIPLFLGLAITVGACGVAQANEGAPWPVCQPGVCQPCMVPSIRHAADFTKFVIGKVMNRPICGQGGGCVVQK